MPALARVLATLAVVVCLMGFAKAADLESVQKDYLRGNYADVISSAGAALKEATGPAATEWSVLLVRTLLTVGRNADAQSAMEQALGRDPLNVRLRWLMRDVDFANGNADAAKARATEIRRLVSARPWGVRAPEDLVAFGRAALELGADPKDVLDRVFAVAQTANPKLRDVYLARGELALGKHDFALAAKVYEEGLKQLPDDPDLLCGQAQAFAGDRETQGASLQAALKVNPRHVPSLLLLADHLIDAEAYNEAEKTLARVVAINPDHPDAWAYRAVLAHLRNDVSGEVTARDAALRTWSRNPRVDNLIGQKLAQKYRFTEAAAYQRRALEMAPDYLPATSELATDLLRLGDAEGWSLAQTVHSRDEYDVEAFNLVTLRDTISKYAALSSDGFVVRMAQPEVVVYGPRVLALLRRARETLVAKYGVTLADPTYVEIFADQKDFAVRTFGLPDIPGFLGVCFGRVVTANSPAATGGTVNWESVLWHEFCHVVTLQMTQNRMPRWLSEGISVYEERQANPSWGMRVDARSREMLLGEDLVPVGQLSGAFLAPKTSQHLQFAYLESSLVVQYIVERHGIDRLRGILADLRKGMEINAALTRNTLPLPQLEKEFTAYAHELAARLAPKLDWERPDPDLLMPGAEKELAAWEARHADNYWLLKLHSAQLLDAEKWAEARKPLERLVELLPSQKGADSAYASLATALRELGDSAAERAVLSKWAAVDDEATDAYLRLMELGEQSGDWAVVRENADRYLAVNPLVPAPYRHLAAASAATSDVSGGIVAWRSLLQLDPPDPSDAHYQLAQLLRRRGDLVQARREVLLALEETPRFRAALQLLTEIDRTDGAARASLPPLPAPLPVPVPKS